MALYLLVDYDNLSDLDKSRDLIITINKLVTKLSSEEVGGKNIQVRLYGGWYENNNITRKAQNLRIEIMRGFPTSATLSDNKTNVIVNVELALSLLVDVRKDLFNTFRRKGIPSGIGANHPNSIGCVDSSCPIINVYDFFNSGRCTRCTTVRPENIIFRHEQKLVDTMLTTDLIDVAITNKKVCVVSSDDDLWPGILYSINKGAKVYHLLTKTTIPPGHYSRTVTLNYTYKTLV